MDSFDPPRGNDDARLIAGAKSSSGSSKSGGGGASSEKDTLFTTATIRLIDLLGEGEIAGLVAGLQSVYLNDVPIQNPDGSFNYKGVSVEYRYGAPDQPYMAGFPAVESPTQVGVKVTQQLPATASIANVNANRARVTMQIPALLIAKTDGSVRSNSVSYRIEARYSGGPWVNALGDQTVSGKASSPFYPSHEFDLPIAPNGQSAPWQVRVSRLSADTDGFNASQDKFTVQSDTIFQTVTEIVDAKFTYPHTAVMGVSADASIFGSSVPTRKYLVDGIEMPVPSNYDPVARTYAGIWDGTFKMAVSSNPAWAFYLILQDDRFGLGEFIDPSVIDKWSLYQIGAYCDGLVPDGADGMEPRFTFNGVISDQHDAFDLLEMIAQAFRGMAYWSSGSVTATQDRPGDPVLLVTPANTTDEEGFSYSSSARRARHTVAIVAWTDPSDLYRTNYELVEDGDGIARYGYNPTRVDLIGCTSRGQAHRAGLWALFSDLHETQVVTYRAGLDHAVARPGDIVAIQDPTIAGIDASGRLLAGSTASTLVLDRPLGLQGPTAFYLSVMLPDGTVAERQVANVTGQGTNVYTLTQPLPAQPDPGAIWVLSGGTVPQLFRVISIKEVEPHLFEVRALQHEPGKYATVDQGAPFVPLPISELTKTVKPPVNLAVREGMYYDLQVPKQTLTLSWTVGDALVTVGYRVVAIQPDGAIITLPQRGSTTADFTDAQTGTWTFLVTAIGVTGATSEAARLDYNCTGWAGLPTVQVKNLQVQGGGAQFQGRSCTMEWQNSFPDTLPPYPVSNVVYILEAGTLVPLHREVLPAGVTKWTYSYDQNFNDGGPRRTFVVQVSALSVAGVEGGFAKLQVSNPAPAAVDQRLSSLSEFIVFDSSTPPDPDLEGYLVYVSETKGFTPQEGAHALDTPFKPAMIPAVAGKHYYVRTAAYDAFSRRLADLNLSNEAEVTVTINEFDPFPPAIPDKPVLTTESETAPDGTVTAVVRGTWTQDTSEIFGRYEVAFAQSETDTAEQNKGYVVEVVDGAKWEKHGFTPGKLASVKVRALSSQAYPSDYSPVVTIVAAANTKPPAAVSNLRAVGSFQNAALSWTASTSKDVAFVEVWSLDGTSSAAAPPTGAILLDRVASGSTSYRDPSLSVSGVRTYWVRPVNTSGIVAETFAGPATATSAQIQQGQLAAGVVDATKFASSIAPIAVVDSLPGMKTTQVVTLTSDGKLYAWDASQGRYTSAVTPGAAAGSVDAVNIQGLIDDTQIRAISAGKVAGQITRTQIADGAISTGQLSAGAVLAGNIGAGQISAEKLAAKAVTANAIDALSVFSNQGVFNNLAAGIAQFGGLTAGQIAAGAITADKIGVGLSSGNLIFGSDGTGAVGVVAGYSDSATSGFYCGPNRSGDPWRPTGMGSYEMSATGAPSGFRMLMAFRRPAADGSWTDRIPVLANTRYEASVYVSCHRCIGQVNVLFYDAAGSYITEVTGNPTVYDSESQGALATWQRSTLFLLTPSNTAYVIFRASGVLSGGNNPYLFASGAYLAVAQPNQSQFSPWTPQSYTVISGGQVATNSLLATSIVANSITADRIAFGSITGDRIAVGTIQAGNIAAGAITADTISVGNGSLSSLINGGNSTKIQGGAIAANTITANLLKIGARQVNLVGVSFYMERDGNNNINGVFHWTAGAVLFQNDAGQPQSYSIPDTRVQIDGGYWYVWFNQAAPGNLYVAKDNWQNIYNDPNTILIATVSGLTGIAVLVGGTIIDGTRIVTRSIQADQIAANAIQAIHIAANTIRGDSIIAGSLAADKIAAGTLTAGTIYVGNSRFILQGDPNFPCIRMFAGYPMDNGSGQYAEVISMGRISAWTGDAYDYGLIIRDNANNEVLRACRSGTYINAAYIKDATITTAKIGTAQIDYLRVAGGAISQVVAAGSNDHSAALVLYCRGPDSKFEIKGFRGGDGSSRYSQGYNSGNLTLQISTDGSNYSDMRSVANVTSYLYDPGPRANYTVPQATTILTSWNPGYTGNLWFRIVDSSSGNSGGVYISVTELAR